MISWHWHMSCTLPLPHAKSLVNRSCSDKQQCIHCGVEVTELSTNKQQDSPISWSKCVFITAVPMTKLFAWGGGETMEDMCYERLRAEACVD
jgi:hypothetical protein